MHPQKKTFLLINLLGGLAVLGSYAQGLGAHPQTRALLWGGIPEPLRPIYGITMWLATAGYLMFIYEVVAHVEPGETRIGRLGFGIINVCCAAVVSASALWMPATFAYIEQPSAGLWLFIRLDLLIVALGALGLLLAFFQRAPRPGGWTTTLTVLGLLFFALQTAFLDAFVWPAFFATGGT
jgi:hypothetical protein